MSVNKVNKTTGDLSLLAGGTLYADNPIGSIIPYGGATAPAGWFICDGTELVRATYPELFAVIGTSFGTPSDNTKFKLPDLRGKFVEGVPISGSVGANISAGLPNITGQFGYLKALSSGNYFEGINERLGAFSSSYNLELDPVQSSAVNSGGETTKSGLVVFRASDSNSIYGDSDTVQPPSVCVNYIIKAVSVGIPADFMSAVDEAVAGLDINTSKITESSALPNIGTAANATQHDVNVAIDSKIGGIQISHQISSLPSDTNTSFPISITSDITIAGVTIPQYSRGYFCAAVDAMAVLVDANGYIYTCYRNVNTWDRCVTNKPNWVQWSEVADSYFRDAFQAEWDAAADYSLISKAFLAGSEGSVFIQKKPGTNRTYGFFSCGTGNYELRHDADGWMVRKITV